MPLPSQMTTSRAAKLSVRGVGKRYDLGNRMTVEAVRDVSFDVTEGEICALLGPSGCGKSTVLRMVAGLEDPSNGAMFLDGKEIHGPDKSRGMVFQRYTSFDWMTVRKNVEYGMRINGVPKAERQKNAERFIQLVKLTKFKDAYPRELSGGMQQRVAIARTLANGPSILLMDEPFGALDAETKWQMQELMIGIVEKSNATVLLVTHDIEEAIFLADRIVFMSRHPGTVREDLVTEFKGGRRLASHEEMLVLTDSTSWQRRSCFSCATRCAATSKSRRPRHTERSPGGDNYVRRMRLQPSRRAPPRSSPP
jgi:ABC-type nitrate/sulfonate/bicarbonate transport system ATPase subunit